MGVYRGSRADLVEFLADHRSAILLEADETDSIRHRNHLLGVAEGVAQAQTIVAEWEIIAPVQLW